MTREANVAHHAKYGPTVRAMPDITVYFLQASRCIRTVWLLEELHLPYAIDFSDRVDQRAPSDFKARSGNPLGKFPTIRDGELIVYESGVITEYLCDKYDAAQCLIPPQEDIYLRNRVLTFVHAAEATLALHALTILYARWSFPEELKKTHRQALDEMEGKMAGNMRNDLDWLEAELGHSTGRFLVGDQVTAADVMMQFSVQFVFERELGTKGGDWPRLREWLARCEGCEGYKRAVERSGFTLYPEKM